MHPTHTPHANPFASPSFFAGARQQRVRPARKRGVVDKQEEKAATTARQTKLSSSCFQKVFPTQARPGPPLHPLPAQGPHKGSAARFFLSGDARGAASFLLLGRGLERRLQRQPRYGECWGRAFGCEEQRGRAWCTIPTPWQSSSVCILFVVFVERLLVGFFG